MEEWDQHILTATHTQSWLGRRSCSEVEGEQVRATYFGKQHSPNYKNKIHWAQHVLSFSVTRKLCTWCLACKPWTLKPRGRRGSWTEGLSLTQHFLSFQKRTRAQNAGPESHHCNHLSLIFIHGKAHSWMKKQFVFIGSKSVNQQHFSNADKTQWQKICISHSKQQLQSFYSLDSIVCCQPNSNNCCSFHSLHTFACWIQK